MTTFSGLNLAQPILRAITDGGYTTPTPIQEKSIPALLQGRDLLGVAQTGTGKTAAFLITIINDLLTNPVEGDRFLAEPRALIIAPTRELAMQIANDSVQLNEFTDLHTVTLVGGEDYQKQTRALDLKPVDIVVATPGRLLDFVSNDKLYLGLVELLVLDEADRMLDMGFIRDIRKIMALLPRRRQNLMFSATFSDDIRKLAKTICHNPVEIDVAPRNSTVAAISQKVYQLGKNQKAELLSQLCKKNSGQTLVFSRTKHGANNLAKRLNRDNIHAAAIHGNKSQGARQRALKRFRDGHARVLVATDIAARGIDIDGVTHVINFELPNEPESYVHRIGRTARAGADGIAIAFCAEDERQYLKDIRKTTDAEFERLPLPDNFRAVVEGVGPTKRAAPGQRMAKPKVRPTGDAAKRAKPKDKHPARKGRPSGAGGPGGGGNAGAGKPGGGRSRNRRRSSAARG